MKIYSILLTIFLISNSLFSQKKKKEINNHLDDISINALKWRSVGPALTSGRISDIAVNKNKPFEYYVAVASGGVWKTSNWGLEYVPVFDSENSYSIGCVTIDPNNPNTIWVGTGENNNQRSVAYGDGVNKSTDGGKSWDNVGLKKSEHIGNIIVDPNKFPLLSDCVVEFGEPELSLDYKKINNKIAKQEPKKIKKPKLKLTKIPILVED